MNYILCGGGRDEELAVHVCACLAETLTPSTTTMNESGGLDRARVETIYVTDSAYMMRLFAFCTKCVILVYL